MVVFHSVSFFVGGGGGEEVTQKSLFVFQDMTDDGDLRRVKEDMERATALAREGVEKVMKSVNIKAPSFEDWRKLRTLCPVQVLEYLTAHTRKGVALPRKIEVWALFAKSIPEKDLTGVTPVLMDLVKTISNKNFTQFHEHVFTTFVVPYIETGDWREEELMEGKTEIGKGVSAPAPASASGSVPIEVGAGAGAGAGASDAPPAVRRLSVPNQVMADRLLKRYCHQLDLLFQKLEKDHRDLIAAKQEKKRVAGSIGRGVTAGEPMHLCITARVGRCLPKEDLLAFLVMCVVDSDAFYIEKPRKRCVLQVNTGHGVLGSVLQVASVAIGVPFPVFMTHRVDPFPLGDPCLWNKKAPVIPVNHRPCIQKYGPKSTVLLLEMPPTPSKFEDAEWATETVKNWRTSAGGEALVLVMEWCTAVYLEDGTRVPERVMVTGCNTLVRELEANWVQVRNVTVPSITSCGVLDNETRVIFYRLKTSTA